MAKRKADELEDFTSKHEGQAIQYGKEDVEVGSALLKDVLVRWKEACDGKDLSKEEMVSKMGTCQGRRETSCESFLPKCKGFVTLCWFKRHLGWRMFAGVA